MLSLFPLLSPLCSASTLPPNAYEEDIIRARRLCLEAMNATSGWVPHSTQSGIAISTRSIPNSAAKATKGEGNCSSPALLLFCLLSDTEHRKEWDSMVDSARELQRVDRLTRVAISIFKTAWPISRREMVVVGRGQREDDGSFFSFATSIDYPSRPTPSGSTRSTLHYYGVRFFPLTPTTCRFQYVACSDPRGYLPMTLVNLASTMQPMTIHKLDKLLQAKKQLQTEAVEAVVALMQKEGFNPSEGKAAGGGALGSEEKEGEDRKAQEDGETPAVEVEEEERKDDGRESDEQEEEEEGEAV